MIGQEMSVDEVIEAVIRDRSFYRRSGGGVTLSGGEAMMQVDFAQAILSECYDRNINTAIETTGFVQWSAFEKVLPYTDLFLFDLKHMDSKVHKKLTCVPNERILENAKKLAESGASIIFRVPLIPECNMDIENIQAIAEFAVGCKVEDIHLMPFHQLGLDKYRRLGRTYGLADARSLPEDPEAVKQMNQFRQILEDHQLKVAIGG